MVDSVNALARGVLHWLVEGGSDVWSPQRGLPFLRTRLGGHGAVRQLSQCEIKILQRLIHDESQRQIAAALGIAVRTVGTHLERIHRKLNVHSRTELIVRLYEAHRDWRRENPPPPGCRGVG
jgi:DNA-binding CsgD family transcriptional regulator